MPLAENVWMYSATLLQQSGVVICPLPMSLDAAACAVAARVVGYAGLVQANPSALTFRKVPPSKHHTPHRQCSRSWSCSGLGCTTLAPLPTLSQRTHP